MELIYWLFFLATLATLLVAENRPADGARARPTEVQVNAEWGLEGGFGDTPEDVTIIGTADGGLHALNSENEELWSTNIPGGPLARSFKAQAVGPTAGGGTEDGELDAKNDFDDNDSDANSEYSVIPTLDGSILVHSNEGMRKTSVTARMLSEQEPYVSNDGLIYTGQRTDRFFGLDLNSGQILHDSGNPDIAAANRADGGRNTVIPAMGSKSRALVDIKQRNRRAPTTSNSKRQLWIGRTDYTLRAFNELTGREEFNLTYSELSPVETGGHKAGKQHTAANRGSLMTVDVASGLLSTVPTNIEGARLLGSGKETTSAQALPVLSTPDGDVYFTDTSGEALYSVSLGSPVVSAFRVGADSKGGGETFTTCACCTACPQRIKKKWA